jgi:hypothetical protein
MIANYELKKELSWNSTNTLSTLLMDRTRSLHPLLTR